MNGQPPARTGHDAAWELTADEQRQVGQLPPRERYSLFLQLAADWEEVWGLHGEDTSGDGGEGWVLSSTGDGRDVFPLWPHPAFAKACAKGTWKGTVPSSIPLGELLDDLLAILTEGGIQVAVFPGPGGDGVLVTPEELKRDLQAEIELGE